MKKIEVIVRTKWGVLSFDAANEQEAKDIWEREVSYTTRYVVDARILVDGKKMEHEELKEFVKDCRIADWCA